MHLNFPIHLRTSAIRSRERDDSDVVTTPNKFMRQHADVEIAPTDKRRGVTVSGLQDPHQTVTSFLPSALSSTGQT